MDIASLRNLDIDKTNLSEELAKQAGRFLFVAEKAVEAEIRYEQAKFELQAKEADIDEKIRAQYDKVTEKFIEKEILRDEEYIRAKRALLEKKGVFEALKALKEAWWMRKDLLIQMAIKDRAELESLLSASVKMAAE